MALVVKTLDETGLPRRDLTLSYDRPFIPRRIFPALVQHLIHNRDIEIISGPRQCGKTTLLAKLVEHLQTVQGISPNQIVYINLDWMADYSSYENPILFWEKLKAVLGEKKTLYLFLDEVQRLKNPGKFLKGLFDLRANLKMVISGSSSLELKAKTKEFLTGRKREFHVHPIALREWADHEGITTGNILPIPGRDCRQFIDALKTCDRIIGKALQEAFLEMAQYGGYPKVLLAPIAQKRDELAEIYTSYIKKDVVDFLKIDRPDLFNNLVKAFAHQTGNLINYSEISSLLGGNQITIKKYAEMLEQTYVIHRLPPLTGNRRNEIKQAHKVYFHDGGLRNYITGSLGEGPAFFSGPILENGIFAEMFKLLRDEIALFFWRTKAGSEVDFAIDSGGKQYVPVEIKAGPVKFGTLTKSFHSFLEAYKPRRALFANQGTIGMKTIGCTEVLYLPYYWIPIIDTIWQPASAKE